MTRSSILTKSVTTLKKQSPSKRSKQQRIALAMYKADLNTIRPRKNVPSWIHPTNFSANKVNEPKYFEKELSLYENQEYLPNTRTNFKTNDGKTKTAHHKIAAKEFKKFISDYCEGSSLHGLKYVGVENVSFFERIFWIISFVGAICFAAFFISNIYQRWIYNPLIVGINPEYQTIFNIPFPAMTICNMNQARKEQAEEVLRGNNDNEKFLLEDVCNQKQNFSTNNTDVHITKWEYIKNFILKVSQPCSNLLVQCKWQGYELPCSNVINSALTDEGVCCTFNRVNNKYMYHNPWTVADFNISFPPNNIDWTPENGYPSDSNNTTWPFRGLGNRYGWKYFQYTYTKTGHFLGAGEHLGLTLIIDVAADEYYCSSTSSVGLKIRLHSPVETPMMADYGFFLHPRKEVRVAVRPTMDQASSTIDKIPISKRQCFFSVEKELFFYRTYTKMNCELECLSNYTLQQCLCVPFYLPKNVNTPICDKRTEECYMKAKNDMVAQHRPSIRCNCLPACNEISYSQDHSLGDISKPELRKGVALEVDPASLIILHVFYQTTQFRSYEKSEIFGFTEFLSNSGGLLGLFLGFSFLSAVEIFYHLTLRLWCVYYKKFKEHEKNVVVYPFTR